MSKRESLARLYWSRRPCGGCDECEEVSRARIGPVRSLALAVVVLALAWLLPEW